MEGEEKEQSYVIPFPEEPDEFIPLQSWVLFHLFIFAIFVILASLCVRYKSKLWRYYRNYNHPHDN